MDTTRGFFGLYVTALVVVLLLELQEGTRLLGSGKLHGFLTFPSPFWSFFMTFIEDLMGLGSLNLLASVSN